MRFDKGSSVFSASIAGATVLGLLVCWICSATDAIYVGRGELGREIGGADPIGAFSFTFSLIWALYGAILLGPLDFRFLGLDQCGANSIRGGGFKVGRNGLI